MKLCCTYWRVRADLPMKLCCTYWRVRADLPTPPSPSTTILYLCSNTFLHLMSLAQVLQIRMLRIRIWTQAFWAESESASGSSVPDLWNFKTDSDPWIRTVHWITDKGFDQDLDPDPDPAPDPDSALSSMTFKMPTKNNFFCLLPYPTYWSYIYINLQR